MSRETSQDESDRSRDPHHIPRRNWGILFLLLLASVCYTVDVRVVMVVAEPVKNEFGLSDAQLGLFTGLSYSLSFALVGLFIGPVIDRRNRSRLLAGLLFLWSALTASGAFVGSFVQLVASRVGVGAAEAGGSPTGLSILADIIPQARRGMAIGLYKTASPIGYFVATMVCGYIASAYGWRAALLAAGIPGMFLAFVILRLVPDPPRGAFDSGPKPEPMKFGEVLRVIVRAPGLGLLCLGVFSFSFANGGAQMFIIPFMIRAHGMPLVEAASYYGAAGMIGALSPIVLGWTNDKVMRRGIHNSCWLAAAVLVAVMAAGLVMATTTTGWLLVATLILWQVLLLGMTSVNYPPLLALSPPAMRGTLMALVLTGAMLVSSGIAPFITGLLSDWLGGSGDALRTAILIMVSLNILSILAFAGSAWQLARRRASPLRTAGL